MSVGALSSTRMLCEEEVMVEEQAYLQALRDTVTYDIHTDSLVLYAADGVVLATFETEDTRLRVFIPYIMGQ